MDKSTTAQFQTYSLIKNSINLPLKIKIFLCILQQTFTKVKSSPISKDLHKKYTHIINIFKKQAYEEKITFLTEHVKLLKSYIEEKEENSTSSEGIDQIKQIQTTCKIKQQFVGFTTWEKRTFKLNKRTLRVRIGNSKKQENLNLHHYYIRHSQKYSKTLILESISPEVPSKQSQIYLLFNNELLFEQIYHNIFSCIVENSVRELLSLSNEKEQHEEQTTTGCETMTKATIILDPKSLNKYFREKDKIIKKLDGPKNRFQQVEMKIPSTKISIDRKKNNKYKIQRIYEENLEKLQMGMSLIHRKPDEKLLHFQNLERFSTNIFVGYFKFLFAGKVYEFLTIVQENKKPNEYVLILKGIDNFISEQYIDFLYLHIKENGNRCKLNIFAIVNEKSKKKLTVDFLLSLLDVSFQKKELDPEEKLEQFWTVRSCEDEGEMWEQKQKEILAIEEFNAEEALQINKKLSKSDLMHEQTKNVKEKYILEPTQNCLQNHDKLKEHFLFTEWKIAKNGGVVCTNESIITEQKKVFKLVLARMGNNLVKNKSIMNFSFPVNVFRKQSHLKTIARNLSYAPILFQSALKMSPLQRLKKATLLQISLNILGISMEKPFNPILGETYQGTIDGCPVSLEQISHHPPIAAYLLKGRGYKMHGIIQSKASLGLNCAKGSSPFPNYIEFEDGVEIEFGISQMVINGLLFGERSFNFEGINYVIDRKNKIGTKLIYGPAEESFFKKSQIPYDAVGGNIVKVQSWKSSIIQSLNKGQKLSTIDGLWHSQIKIDKQYAIDFRVDLPPALRDIEQPIQSDSRYRADLRRLIEGNLQLAQEEKDFMEEVQRRDRRLREAANNKNK